MWPLRKKKPVSRAKQSVERLVAGLIIGGAIGSIVGKKLIDNEEADDMDEGAETDDDVI